MTSLGFSLAAVELKDCDTRDLDDDDETVLASTPRWTSGRVLIHRLMLGALEK